MIAEKKEMQLNVATTTAYRKFHTMLEHKTKRSKADRSTYLQSPELQALAMAVKGFQLNSYFRIVNDPTVRKQLRLTCLIKPLNPVSKKQVETFLDVRASEIERYAKEASDVFPELKMFFVETARRARKICSDYVNS